MCVFFVVLSAPNHHQINIVDSQTKCINVRLLCLMKAIKSCHWALQNQHRWPALTLANCVPLLVTYTRAQVNKCIQNGRKHFTNKQRIMSTCRSGRHHPSPAFSYILLYIYIYIYIYNTAHCPFANTSLKIQWLVKHFIYWNLLSSQKKMY